MQILRNADCQRARGLGKMPWVPIRSGTMRCKTLVCVLKNGIPPFTNVIYDDLGVGSELTKIDKADRYRS